MRASSAPQWTGVCVFCLFTCALCFHPVPEPPAAAPSLGPPPFHLHPASPALPRSSTSSPGNGKRASASGRPTPPPTPPQQQQQQQQCPLSSASARYPPREVPPRFRQQEHKQLLKRGQPLPVGALAAPPTSSSSCSPASTTNSTNTTSTTTVGEQHSGLFHTPSGFVMPAASLFVSCVASAFPGENVTLSSPSAEFVFPFGGAFSLAFPWVTAKQATTPQWQPNR